MAIPPNNSGRKAHATPFGSIWQTPKTPTHCLANKALVVKDDGQSWRVALTAHQAHNWAISHPLLPFHHSSKACGSDGPPPTHAAKQLAQDDRYQFQWWALSLVKAKPLGGQEGSKIGKKGSDKGIDGIITFIDDNTGKPKRVLVQVKSGHVKSGDIRDLVGTVQRENAALGVFITLEPPSRDMSTEAVTAGYYESPGWNQKYRFQVFGRKDVDR